MIDRKKELKKWFIDHPEVTPSMLAAKYGKTPSVAHNYLFHLPSAPADFPTLCRDKGVPGGLLPDPTRTKADLLDENARLRVENARLRVENAELKANCGSPA
jgi:hypothetical protein